MICFLLIAVIGLPSSLADSNYVAESCPNPDVVQNFNITAYLGKWYEQERDPIPQEEAGKCNIAVYSVENGTVRLKNEMIVFNLIPVSIMGTLKFNSTNDEAKFEVTPDYLKTRHVPYWVLSTDYTGYSIVWSCRVQLGIPIGTAWILTRERNPPDNLIEKARGILEEKYISTESLKKTDQKDCKN